jgi:hypothetical protein
MAGGTGGTAGEALELLLTLLQQPEVAPELRQWDLLPVPGPSLVSGLITAYGYDP